MRTGIRDLLRKKKETPFFAVYMLTLYAGGGKSIDVSTLRWGVGGGGGGGGRGDGWWGGGGGGRRRETETERET